MKRVLLVLIFMTVFILASCVPQKSVAQTTKEAFAGELIYMEGVVTMDGKSIEIGTQLTDGALLQTDADGIAEIVFDTKNIIKMGPSTNIKLELATLNRVVAVEKGTIAAVLRKIDKLNGGGLTVRTPTAIAGVRGTSFFVRVNPEEKESYMCICNGRINLALIDGTQSIDKEANHHDATIFSGLSSDITIHNPGSLFNYGHTDKDLEDLAAKIGEKMNWSVIE